MIDNRLARASEETIFLFPSLMELAGGMVVSTSAQTTIEITLGALHRSFVPFAYMTENIIYEHFWRKVDRCLLPFDA